MESTQSSASGAESFAPPATTLSPTATAAPCHCLLLPVAACCCLLLAAAGCLMGLIAITSVPCVTPKLNWREWRLLQSHAGWLAVITATVSTVLTQH